MNSKHTMMRPQDIVILLKKITPSGRAMSGKQLSQSLGISPGEVSESMERSRISALLDTSKSRVNTQALRGYLIYGLKYSFPIQPSGVVRGVPTASSAAPIADQLSIGAESFVWPYLDGTARGQAVQPLYSSVPEAVQSDHDLYTLLVAADCLRIGRAREIEIAIQILDKYFLEYAQQQ